MLCVIYCCLQVIQDSILAVIETLPPRSAIAIITFAKIISVYELNYTPPVSSLSFNGNNSPENADLKYLKTGRDRFLVSVENVKNHIASIQKKRTNNREGHE
jgi:hypothetical protein